ncbi:ATP-binding protein [Micromonospora sp. NPDC000089]|uniref:ATP-binding protein n=1 Tax=unclassified Micromonospora TaxID=2617518 RepID=UPI00367C7512
MQFELLGDFHAFEGDRRIQIRSMQVRALLATLLLAPGQRASHEYIADRLWPKGDYNPTRVRSCCRKLRSYFPDAMPDSNERRYCSLRVDRTVVDYFRFEDNLELARLRQGADRIGTLRDALAEWRGEPLGEITGADLSDERQRLDQSRLRATFLLLDELLKVDTSGFNRELRPALRRWPADQPLLSLELRFLASTDGPSRVRQRYQEWTRLHGAPDAKLERYVDQLTRRSVTKPAQPGVPRQLPPHRAPLAGRQAELSALSEALLADALANTGLAVVTGMAGVGKTQLAQHWAASVEGDFPDGTLYVDLNGYTANGSPEQPAQLLARILNDLGVRPRTPTVDGMSTEYRTELARRKTIVLLDNARDVHQVRPLLPGTGSSVAVVTSRDRLMQMIVREHAHEVRLGPLGHEDAVALLTSKLGAARMRAGAEHISEIVALCGGLPLALSIVAAQARSRPPEALEEITAALREEGTRLDSLGHRSAELNVRAALSSSYGTLSAPAAELFARLAIHPGPTISRRAVGCLAEDTPAVAIDELIEASLLDEPAVGRFAFHDLVRIFAADRTAAMRPEDYDRVDRRVSDFLLRNTWACDRVLAPDRGLPIAGPDDIDVVAPASSREAMAWLHAEYATVTAAIRRAHARQEDRYTWLLSMSLVTYQWRTHRYADAERYLSYAAVAAGRVAGPADQAMVYRMLAGSRRGLGDLEHAKADLRRAISLSEAAGHPLSVAHSRHSLGLLHRESGEPQTATELFESALSAYRRLGDVLGEAGTLRGLGTVRFDLGDHEGALRRGQEALRLFLTTADVNSQASTFMDLGRVHTARRDGHSALDSFASAADRYAWLTYPRREATALLEMSEVLNTLNRVPEARTALREAVDLLRELDPVAADEAESRLAALSESPR